MWSLWRRGRERDGHLHSIGRGWRTGRRGLALSLLGTGAFQKTGWITGEHGFGLGVRAKQCIGLVVDGYWGAPVMQQYSAVTRFGAR